LNSEADVFVQDSLALSLSSRARGIVVPGIGVKWEKETLSREW
jgi:hypothetical protein